MFPLKSWCVTAAVKECRTLTSVTVRRDSVTVCRDTLGCSVKSVRKTTSPTAPSAACPAHVTPSVPTAPAVTGERHCGKIKCLCVLLYELFGQFADLQK